MKKFFKSYSIIFIFAVVSAFVLAMTLYSRSLSDFFVKSSEYNIRIRLSETCKRLANFVSSEELDMYQEVADMEKPEYQALRLRLLEFSKDADILYAFYVRQVENQLLLQYIVDNDFNDSTRVGLDTPPVVFGVHEEVLKRVLKGESWVSELGVYLPDWPGILSAYCPVFDSDGKVVAIAGADINDEEIVSARKRVFVLLILQAIAVIAVFACGVYGFAKYRREAVAAKEASNAKSKFLSLISHEIRTPMNAILGITEIQLQNETLPPETEDGLEKVYDSGILLLNIINDILDLSKIEAGKLEIVPVEYTLPNLINNIAQANRLSYDFKPIKFILEVDENLPLNMFGDELRLRQVMGNILSNAFKYTDEGEVRMSVRAEPLNNAQSNSSVESGEWRVESDANLAAKEQASSLLNTKSGNNSQLSTLNSQLENDVYIVFKISDTGRGMTREQLNTLFDEYTRFNMEANRTTVGTGLGMNIAKRLVNLMNGKILVESEVGKGSVFTVQIPQKRINELVCGKETAEKLREFSFQSASMSKKGRLVREHIPYGKVLVVDDVGTNLYVTRGMLLPYGLQVDTASSGPQAIEKIKAGNVYDIIFMDHMMPKMDGMETVQRIREWERQQSLTTNHSPLTIIALTANALVGQAEMFLQNGFDGYISKPIDLRELNQILNEFIRNKKNPEIEETVQREVSEMEELFVMDAESAIATLEEIYAKPNEIGEKEINSYEITVHGMKSALANVGETELSAVALKLEKAAKDKNLAAMTEETPAFIDALKLLVKKWS